MEYFDVCDENGQPTGETIERKAAHREGVRHRTAHVWIVRFDRGEPQVLLQKRSAEKDSFPGCLDTSSAGHIQAGDEPLASALRELNEELGIAAQPDELAYAGYFVNRYEEVFHGEVFRDNEYANVFVYTKPVDISSLTLQKEEIESVGWYGWRETVEACRRHDPAYCVPMGGLEVLGRVIERMKPEPIE